MEKKKCFKCGIIKPLKEFYKHSGMKDGYLNKCKECDKIDVRLNSRKNKEHYRGYYKNRIRNDINYMFIHRYSGMLARSDGRCKQNYSVIGKTICSKDDFLKWCYSDKIYLKFITLYFEWRKNNYCRKLCPSIDRIDNNKGYIVENLQWLTQQKNSSKYNK